MWEQNRSVEHFPTSCLRENQMPPLHEFGMMHLMMLSGNDHWNNVLGVFCFIGCLAAISLLIKECGSGDGCANLRLLVRGNPARSHSFQYWTKK